MKWLHLSDLHYNPQNDGRSTHQLREKLLKYLQEAHITADHLFLTGDYRHAKYQRENEADAAKASAEFILQIAGAAKILPEGIHIIPGNHDLSRLPETGALDQIKQKYDAHNGRLGQADAALLLGRFTFFRLLMQELGRSGVKPVWPDTMLPLHVRRSFESFHLLCLNTGIFCNSDRDRGELIIGNYDLYRALEEMKQADSGRPIIVLGHHGLDNFREDERKAVETLFAEYPVRLYLCGDAHMPWKRRTNGFMEITMGCLVQEKYTRTVFSAGALRRSDFSIEAHSWDADEGEWGEYTQFNKKLRKWPLYIHTPVHRKAETVTKERPVSASPHFIGREETVRELESRLFSKTGVVFLYGIGGIGKTEICRELYERYASDAEDGGIRYLGWITYRETLKNSFFDQFSGLAADDPDAYWDRARQKIAEMGDALLLFLDNANQMTPQEVAALDRLGCHVLITARGKRDTVQNMETDSLKPEACRRLYRLYSEDDHTGDEIIDQIVSLAAGHTLSIELLAKTQYAAGMDACELLCMIEKSGFDLSDLMEEICYLHDPESEKGEWNSRFIEHMARIFDLSEVSTLPEELRIVQLFSLLASNTPVPVKTVRKWLDLKSLNAMNSVIRKGWLNKYVWQGTQFLVMHPVISSVIRYAAMPDEAMAGELAERIGDDLKIDEAEGFTRQADKLPHAAALAEKMDFCDVRFARMLNKAALLYDYQGMCDTGIRLAQRALEMMETVLGKEDWEIGVVLTNIAYARYMKGEYDRGIELCGRVLDIYEKNPKVPGDLIATAYNNMALCCSRKGLYQEALRHYETVMDIYKEEKMEESLAFARLCNNMGHLSVYLGGYERALEWLENGLRIQEHICVAPVQLTAALHNNKGLAYFWAGDYKEAKAQFLKAVELQQTLWKEGHPDQAVSYGNMGMICIQEAAYPEALEWLKKAMEIQEKVLIPQHPDLALTYNHIGLVYYYTEGYDEALVNFFRAFHIQEKVLEKGHYDMVATCNNIGMVYYYKGEYEKSLGWCRRALEGQDESGHMPPDMIMAYCHMGLICEALGNHERAVALCQKAYDLMEAQFGPHHPYLSVIKENLQELPWFIVESDEL